MKVAIINTKQSGGGAAIAASRLHQALRAEGVDATLVVAEGEGGEATDVLSNTFIGKIKYKLNFIGERFRIWIANRFTRKNLFAISTADSGTDISQHPAVKSADIIHLHWVNQGMLSLKNIEQLVATGKPIVITPHDMWYATSICHHAGQCNKYTTGCSNCPYLAKPSDNDLSAKVWKRKQNLYQKGVTFVVISRWMAERLNRSTLTKGVAYREICNVIDTETFCMQDKSACRKELDIDANEKVLVFGAAKLNDPIKGADMLFSAIEKCGMKDDILLLLFGSIKNDEEFLSRIPCRYKFIGSVTDKSKLVQIYSAADIVVVPSHYESLSLVIAEAMACGTPALAFDSGGQTTLIDHKENGYLAHYPSVDDFAEGINWLLQNADEDMRKSANKKINRIMSPKNVALQHIELYKSLLHK
ncbi:MAG: glycosyltransferase [Bacteroidales bacterium]|nr:glycosyltransferase [Bacteroidales bacterium]